MPELTLTYPTSIELAQAALPRVGNTPLVRLQRVSAGVSPAVEVWAKCEWTNPSGSVKDRPAYWILRQAVEQGDLGDGRRLLDSTSGNMGIAYATLAAPLGVGVHLAIPSNAGPERLAILRALGAELTLTDPTEGSDGAREVAAQMAAEQPSRFFYADQYSHPANWRAHFETTGPEVLAQSEGRVTHFVAGLGTTGTVTGAGRFLRQSGADVRVIGVQPSTPLHGLEGLKHLATSPVPPIYDPTVVDETIAVDTEDAYAMARRIAREEGLLVGVSSAAAAGAALQLASRLESGFVVVLFPDSGLKYLGHDFWSRP
jgi:cysteine synthase B